MNDPKLPFDAADVRKALGLLERIAKATERIADAREVANQMDPLLAIERALAGGEKPDQLIGDFGVVAREGPGEDPLMASIPESDRWRFR